MSFTTPKRLAFTISLLTLLTFSRVDSQDFSGKVIDTETNLAISFVHVFEPKTNKGTITNEQGEFLLKIENAKDTIVFSHLNYEASKQITFESGIVIKLRPRTIILAEIEVTDYARVVAVNAFKMAVQNASLKNYGKAFYRQITRNDEVPTEIHEIFYTLETANSGVTRHAIDEARFALKKRNEEDGVFFHFANFSSILLGSSVISTMLPKQKKILIPFMPMADSIFNFSLKEKFAVGNKKYMVIHFEPNDDIKALALIGEVVLNEESLSILRFDASLKNSLGADRIQSKSGKSFNAHDHIYHFVFDFTETPKGPKLNYIEAGVNFMLRTEDQKELKVDVKSFLFVYEQYLKKPKRLTEMNLDKNDLEQIRSKKYNPKFWKDNPIVKRTPLEDGITKYFEESGSFGTIFQDKKQ